MILLDGIVASAIEASSDEVDEEGYERIARQDAQNLILYNVKLH